MWLSPLDEVIRVLTSPDRLCAPSAIYGMEPHTKGIYAWWFKDISSIVPVNGTRGIADLNLLYVGIGPSTGKSKQSLRDRLKSHISPNTTKSTLRRTLACLLSETQMLQLEVARTSRKKSSKAVTHHFGLNANEQMLSTWMDSHAKVSWAAHDRPWDVEQELIQILKPPLNIDRNERHPFYEALCDSRQKHFGAALQRWKAERRDSDSVA
jgi:hypothetical protein